MSVSAQPSSHLQAAQADEPEMTGFGEGSMIGAGRAKRDIAESLQDLLGIPVVDETGLRGKYDYSATSRLTDPDAALDLARQLGFDLKPAEKPSRCWLQGERTDPARRKSIGMKLRTPRFR
jgi:uncharacterized protein (TIGR03435 family)